MGPSAAKATMTLAADQDVLAGLENRTENAFSDEERKGLMLAAKTRTIAFAVILLWQIVDSPHSGLAYVYVLSLIVAFGALGLVQYLCARAHFHMDILKYIFVLADCALLAAALTFDNPYRDYKVPASFAMDGSPFAFFFVFLMQSTFSLRPALVLWCGACIVIARTGMLLWVLAQPGVFTHLDLSVLTAQVLVAATTDPNFVFLEHWAIEVIVTLLVAGGLAIVVSRSRRLVANRSLAERARANLARYFSPNVVDRLSGAQEKLRAVRKQHVAVLFADIMDFTRLCEKETPDSVVALLRDYHDRFGQAVFDNDGTLDKYLGDGLMATFGTPETGPRDAQNALRCALDMIGSLDAWNVERVAANKEPVRVGIGLHYGLVIAGDIGNERRLEYSVIGDTVNIASRLEQLTRSLDTTLVASDSLVKAIDLNSDDGKALVLSLCKAGIQKIRGRDAGVLIWTLNRSEPK